MPEPIDPFLRWAGSKRQLVKVLSSYWQPQFKRYVEPFMGSACLFFSIQPQQAILSDINSLLVKTFLAVRDHPRAVANRLAKIPKGRQSYYRIRGLPHWQMSDVDAAACFIFLNRYCFNGLFRTNNSGFFNVPFTGAKTGVLPPYGVLTAASKSLAKSDIIEADFEDTLENTSKGDFVYLDPPYAVSNRRLFRQYGPSSFGLHDLKRLATSLRRLDRRGVSFVLSYAHSKEAVEHFSNWPMRRVYVQRNIAGFVSNRRQAAELLFSNCQLHCVN